MVGCTRFLLASLVWLVHLSSDAAAGECGLGGGPSVVDRGEIALADAPFCAFFVVATNQGFSLLRLQKGREVFAEGDRVLGPLHARGRQHVTLPDWHNDVLEVEIEEIGASMQQAQAAFKARCAESGSTVGGLASAGIFEHAYGGIRRAIGGE